MKNGKIAVVLWILVTLAVFTLCVCLGRYTVSVGTVIKLLFSKVVDITPSWTGTEQAVVWNLRIPRALMAMLIGSSLALAGTSYQGVFKNPLISPDILGVSAGACVGAAAAILSCMGKVGIQISALAGGLLAVFLATAMPRLFRNRSTLMLVLSGIMVSGFMDSIIGIMKFTADSDTKLAELTYWMMGSIAGATMKDIASITLPVLVSMAVLLRLRWKVNILSLGDEEARGLGVNVPLVRGTVILCSTIITACSVSVSGTVGWVGLVIPHLARAMVGHDNTRVMPVTIFLGGSFMMVTDTAARFISAAELPLSIVTSFIGAPLFAYMLYRQEVKML